MTDEDSKHDLGAARDQKVQLLRRQEQERMAQLIAKQANLLYKDLTTTPIDGGALTIISEEESVKTQSVIFAKKEHLISLGATDPNSNGVRALIEKLEQEKWRISLFVISNTSFEHALVFFKRFAYLKTKITGEVNISYKLFEEFRLKVKDVDTLKKEIGEVAPSNTSQLIELVLGGAMSIDSSDIHIEPQQTQARIRLRIDGVLYDLLNITPQIYHLVLERVKLLSGIKLNVSDKGQDGRFSINTGNEEIEIRASTLPGEHGEYIVMRVLNPTKLISIDDLGLRPDLLDLIQNELKKPNGMVLTTGPTGSGKTTALAAFVQNIASSQIKIITIEDPIEYRISGIEQTQVAPEKGYDFANGLTSIVRQDPDVILVGEIRDKETATIAIQAALTGHLVFSTLHTNDAAGAIPRLEELGVTVDTIAPAINVTMAQRLIRRACKYCAVQIAATPEEITKIKKALAHVPKNLLGGKLDGDFKLPQTTGCTQCNNTGYKGRIGIFELLIIDETMEDFILKKPGNHEIREWAIDHGMVPMQQDGILKILEGLTTVEELERITGPLGE